MFNKKGIRTVSLMLTLTYFVSCSSVCIIDFEHAVVRWVCFGIIRKFSKYNNKNKYNKILNILADLYFNNP